MQADHARDARKLEDELAQAAEGACTCFFAEMLIDVARCGSVIC